MDVTVTPEELDRLEQVPLDERADALEAIERALRTSLDHAPPA